MSQHHSKTEVAARIAQIADKIKCELANQHDAPEDLDDDWLDAELDAILKTSSAVLVMLESRRGSQRSTRRDSQQRASQKSQSPDGAISDSEDKLV